MKRWTRLTTFEQTIVGIRINETLQTDAFGNQIYRVRLNVIRLETTFTGPDN